VEPADALADLTTRLRAVGIEPGALWYLNDDPDNLDNFVSVDRWLTQEWDDNPFYEYVMAGLTTGTLMNYSDDADRLLDQGATFLTGADAIGRPAEIAVETGWGDPTPHVSLSDLVRTDPDAFYALMAELDVAYSSHPTYAGIAVHHYAQFFAGLNDGVEPHDFGGEVTVVCAGTTETETETETDTATDAEGNACGCASGSGGAGGFAGLLVAWASVVLGRSRRSKGVT
jgi:hypothetical protein